MIDLTQPVTTIIKQQFLTNAELQDAITRKEEVKGYTGFVKTTPSVLQEKVSKDFLNYQRIETEEYEDEEEVIPDPNPQLIKLQDLLTQRNTLSRYKDLLEMEREVTLKRQFKRFMNIIGCLPSFLVMEELSGSQVSWKEVKEPL